MAALAFDDIHVNSRQQPVPLYRLGKCLALPVCLRGPQCLLYMEMREELTCSLGTALSVACGASCSDLGLLRALLDRQLPLLCPPPRGVSLGRSGGMEV